MNEGAPNHIAVGVAIRMTAMIAATQPMAVFDVDFNQLRSIDRLRPNSCLVAHSAMEIAKKAATPPGSAARLMMNFAIFGDAFSTIVNAIDDAFVH